MSNTLSNSTSVRVAKNTGYLYAKLLVSLCFTLYTTRIILGTLGASDYGIWGVLGSAISMLGFLNTSMAAATQRFMNYYEGRGDIGKKTKIFNSAVIIHIGIALFIGVVFLFSESLMFDMLLKVDPNRIMAAKWIYRIVILSTMVTVTTVPYDAVVNSHEDMFYYSIVGIIDVILKFLLALYVTITPYDKLIVYGVSVLSVAILTFFMMFFYCNSRYKECIFNPKKHFDKTLVKEMFTFGGWSLVGTSSAMISNYGMGIVINRFFGTIINATQSVCNQFVGIMLVLSTNLMKAVNPVIVKREGSGDRKKMFDATFLSCKLSYLMYVFIGIPFFLECNYILGIWLKEVPPYCLQFCELVFILKLIEQITTPLNTSIVAVGRIKLYNIVISLIQIFQIVLVIGFFTMGAKPYFSEVAMIIAAFCCSLFKIFFCNKYLSMNLSSFLTICGRCLVHLILCLGFGLLLRLVMPPSFIRLISVVAIIVTSNILLSLFVLFNYKERIMVLNTAKNILKPILKKIKKKVTNKNYCL